jgi:hypothetical protein
VNVPNNGATKCMKPKPNEEIYKTTSVFGDFIISLSVMNRTKRKSGLRQEDHEFEGNLGYIARPCLKKKKKKKKMSENQ